MRQLFSVAKVPVFCDAVGHKTEARRGESVKVLELHLRVSPFDKKLARALIVPEVADTMFGLNSAKPRRIRRAEFDPPTERQMLRLYAAPDVAEPSLLFDQVKVGKLVVRMTKDRTAHDLHFTIAFGPCGRRELEYVQDYLFSQRFVSFEEAEPGLFDEPEKRNPRHRPKDPGENAKGEPLEFDAEPDGRPIDESPAREAETARPPQRRHPSRQAAARAKQASSRKPTRRR